MGVDPGSRVGSEEIKNLFGPSSPLYPHAIGIIEAFAQDHEEETLPAQTKWKRYFSQIHRVVDVNEQLFYKHAFFALIAKVVLHLKLLNSTHCEETCPFTLLEEFLINRGVALAGTEFFAWAEQVHEVIELLFEALQGVEFVAEDIFQGIYQELTSPATRHAFGEFYTPPALAGEMVNEVFVPGQTALDPACGSGTFLVGMGKRILNSDLPSVEQLTAIGGLSGLDVHPLAVLATQSNMILLLADHNIDSFPLHIFLADALFPPQQLPPMFPSVNQVDLIIGNPPWLVLNGINSKEYQARVKDLAAGLGIMRGGKHATHTELSALFFYRCRDLFLREGGRIFFVVTAGFLSGDQHAKFRQFKGFGEPFAWRFDRDVFRIHNICLGLRKVDQPLFDRLHVLVTTFQCLGEGENLQFMRSTPQIYVPYNLPDIQTEGDLVLRLIPETDLPGMLPPGKSPYLGKFYQGASLVPRTLLFVTIQSDNGATITIAPDMNVQCKPPWDVQPYETAEVEQEYLYSVAKSTDLVLFKLLRTQLAFLPIDFTSEYTDSSGRSGALPALRSLAQAHFDSLNQIYKERQKGGASITDLWARLNYNRGLANARQVAPRKVIFRGIGGYTQAALVEGKIVVDTSCYFYAVDSEEEAYYLLAVLNSLAISRDLRKRGSTGASGSLRNLHKKPLEYNIPLYDAGNPLHQELIATGHAMEHAVDVLVEKWRAEEIRRAQLKEDKLALAEGRPPATVDGVPLRPHAIQKRIMKDLVEEFQKLDTMVVSLLK
ncbi:MAG TPA: N-6 DNA methylase [Candidatus Lokiarchaeia archaeon]|nr:N-6 DNA methylase [Candidatus Lokiarchaeia archaeon]